MSDIEQRLREAMDGVTPGPWEHDGGDIFTVSQECCNLPRVLCDADPATGEPIPYGEECCGSPNIEQCLIANTSQSNAAYIALCSPDNIGALLDTIAALRKQVSDAVGALEKCQSVLAMLTSGDGASGPGIASAYAQCVEAELSARSTLASLKGEANG